MFIFKLFDTPPDITKSRRLTNAISIFTIITTTCSQELIKIKTISSYIELINSSNFSKLLFLLICYMAFSHFILIIGEYHKYKSDKVLKSARMEIDAIENRFITEPHDNIEEIQLKSRGKSQRHTTINESISSLRSLITNIAPIILSIAALYCIHTQNP